MAIYILVVLAAIFLLFRFVLTYLTPFIIAGLLAMLIDPLVGLLQRKVRLSRGAAVALILGLVLMIFSAVVAIGISQLIAELSDLVASLPEYQARFVALLEYFRQRVTGFSAGLPKPLVDAMQDSQRRLYETLALWARSVLQAVQLLPNFFVVLVVSFLATYFISRDKEAILKYITHLTPRSWRQQMFRVRSDVGMGVIGYFRAQITLMLVTTTLSILGLLILRVRYAWLLGLAAGLLDLVPMVGPSGIFVPWLLYNFFLGDIGLGVGLTVVLAMITVVRQISEPRIVGAHIGLHPLATLMAIYLGFRILGVWGFFLGPVTLIVLKAIFAVTIEPVLPKE
ncbi:MAG: sporulation integral membrane protein YtvI [Firmicutes bacterium]|nr:sporulation integral membrane protein YtvI [Bacillota bacterium]